MNSKQFTIIVISLLLLIAVNTFTYTVFYDSQSKKPLFRRVGYYGMGRVNLIREDIYSQLGESLEKKRAYINDVYPFGTFNQDKALPFKIVLSVLVIILGLFSINKLKKIK